MLIEGHFPFIGEVTWLAPQEGGRPAGVPPVVEGLSYAQVAHVLPRNVGNGSELWRSGGGTRSVGDPEPRVGGCLSRTEVITSLFLAAS